MRTGFVILNYNSSDLTVKLAKSIEQYSMVDYIFIIDNNSTDDSKEILSNIVSKKILFFETGKNGGYSYGNNYGAKICKKFEIDVMFVANPDIKINEVDIGIIINAFKNSDYSLLTGVQYEIDGSVGDPPILVRNTYSDDLIECFWMGRKFFKTNYGKKVDKTILIQEMNMFKGSFFGVKLCDFLIVGGFDERFFLYCEERVLARRLEENNKKIGIVTNARYDHMHSKSISRSYTQQYKRMKLLYTSRLLYNRLYNKIGIIKVILLICAMNLSLVEFYFKDKIQIIIKQGA